MRLGRAAPCVLCINWYSGSEPTYSTPLSPWRRDAPGWDDANDLPAPTVSVIVGHPTSHGSHSREPGWDVIQIVGWCQSCCKSLAGIVPVLLNAYMDMTRRFHGLVRKQSLVVTIRATPTSHSFWTLSHTGCTRCTRGSARRYRFTCRPDQGSQ